MDTRCWSGVLVLLAGLWMGAVYAQEIVEPIQPLRKLEGLNPAAIALGQRLFRDPRLSKDDSLSCTRCHQLQRGGSDNLPVSIGVGGKKGIINAPTVYNLNTHTAYFADGRAATLEILVDGPLRNPLEMAADWSEVVSKLKNDSDLVAEFDRVFDGEGISKKTISQAIATFLQSLVTVDSRMDKWLMGDKAALSPAQLRGYRLFKSYGCIACHQGEAVGGNMYATMGAINNYFEERNTPVSVVDQGRYNVTHDMDDMHVFKLPSLRMVVATAPYFHDASADTLEKAIAAMARYQLGRDISDEDVNDIKAFLSSLLGTHALLTVQK